MFLLQKHMLLTTRQHQLQEQPQNIGLYLVTYVKKDYELDINFDDTELKNNQTTHPTIKLIFHEICVVIEEEWFDDMNLTSGATFPESLIKRAKTRINKNNFPRDTEQRIRQIEINNGWNIQVVEILREIRDGNLFSMGIFLVDYQNLLNYHTSGSRKISGIRSQSFTLDFLMS